MNGQKRRWKKPCKRCGHGKSVHRVDHCRHQWVTMGPTWTGRGLVHKYCLCIGYQPLQEEAQ